MLYNIAMFLKNTIRRFWSDVVQLAAGGAIGAALVAVFGPSVSEAFYDAKGEVNSYRARAAGGIAFETKGGTTGEKKCLAETEKFVQTLPENFIGPIKGYGIFVRVAEVDVQEVPNFRSSSRRVTLYYDRQTKSCSSSFSTAHELGHAFDLAKNTLSDSAAYRKAVDDIKRSPEIKTIYSNPAALAQLYDISNGNPEKLIREETFADIMACRLLPDARESNFFGACGLPAAANTRAYVAAALKP